MSPIGGVLHASAGNVNVVVSWRRGHHAGFKYSLLANLCSVHLTLDRRIEARSPADIRIFDTLAAIERLTSGFDYPRATP